MSHQAKPEKIRSRKIRKGRDSRIEARLATKAGAVRGGLSGGALKPLSDHDVTRVHDAVLDVLETVGIGSPSQELLDITLPQGCFLGPQDRLCFPRALVEDMLACAAREFTVYARGSRSPDWDAHIGGDRVYFGIGAETVSILDPETGRYRRTTIADL